MFLLGSYRELYHLFGGVVGAVVDLFVEEVVHIFLFDGLAFLRPVCLFLELLAIQICNFVFIFLRRYSISQAAVSELLVSVGLWQLYLQIVV